MRHVFVRVGTVIALSCLQCCYSTREFEGDGTITHIDSAWCEYAIELPSIDAGSKGVYEFEFGGCPPKTLHVGLVLADRKRDEPALTQLSAVVSARLLEADSAGMAATVFELEGPLVNDRTVVPHWFGSATFILPPSQGFEEADRAASWSYGAGWYRFRPNSRYKLRLETKVTSAESHGPIWLTPLIWGGGLMQPVGLAQN